MAEVEVTWLPIYRAVDSSRYVMLLHCTSTIIDYHIVPNCSSLFCLLFIFSTEKKDRWQPYLILTKTVLSIATIPDTDEGCSVGSNDCCIGMIDHTEASEPSKAGEEEGRGGSLVDSTG